MSDPNIYGQEQEFGYGSSGYERHSGYGSSSGYEPDGYGAADAGAYGAGDTSWQRDVFSDGYQENTFAVNFLDTPYSETAANPNPESSLRSLSGQSDSYSSVSSSDGNEIEQ